MQHVADDVLCVVLRLLPGHLDGAGRQRLGVVVLADAVDGQRAAGEREINKNPFCCYIFGQMIKQYKRANVSSRL